MNPSVLPLTEPVASADGNGGAVLSDPRQDPKMDLPGGWSSENTTGDNGESAVAPLTVVIAYDSIPAGQRALSIVTRLLGQEIQIVNLYRSLWRLDLIDDPECHEQIIADTTAADLLILSAGEPEAHFSATEIGCRSSFPSATVSAPPFHASLAARIIGALHSQESVIARTDTQPTMATERVN